MLIVPCRTPALDEDASISVGLVSGLLTNSTPALPSNGYSIVEATDRDAALALVVGHPFLSDKTGTFSVDVFELLPVPM